MTCRPMYKPILYHFSLSIKPICRGAVQPSNIQFSVFIFFSRDFLKALSQLGPTGLTLSLIAQHQQQSLLNALPAQRAQINTARFQKLPHGYLQRRWSGIEILSDFRYFNSACTVVRCQFEVILVYGQIYCMHTHILKDCLHKPSNCLAPNNSPLFKWLRKKVKRKK